MKVGRVLPESDRRWYLGWEESAPWAVLFQTVLDVKPESTVNTSCIY